MKGPVQKRTELVPSGFVGLRTPALPWKTVERWVEELEAPAVAADDPEHLESALERDRNRLRTGLRELVAQPAVREALFVASPDLESQLDTWLADPNSESGRKVERSLVRYFLRMSGRATPFGLFSGCSVGKVGEETHLSLVGMPHYQRHTRLDMDYVYTLINALASDSALREALTYFPNSSLYRTASQYRYAEARLRGRQRMYELVAVDQTDYLDRTLERAQSGAALSALAAGLTEDDPDVSLDEALGYVNELVNAQILVSQLEPAMTGPEPVSRLVEELRRLPQMQAFADCLQEASDLLAGIDARGIGASPEAYRNIARMLESLPVPIEVSRLFQVDMVKPAPHASISHTVIDEAAKAIEALHRLSGYTENSALARFREQFLERYESREVPLVEALDEEIGIGFSGYDAEPLLDGLGLGLPAEEARSSWKRREAVMLGKLTRALAENATEIVIEPRDIEAMAEANAPPMPASFAAMASLAAESDAAVSAGNFRLVLEGTMGPSGAKLFGRFCHADPVLNDLVEQHLRQEEALDPDAIFAEIVHLPQGRLGNILLRPVLRKYEIPFLGKSSVPAECQIPITDLLVSVRANRVELRSRRLGKRVTPRLTTAHNYLGPNLGLYRFLCLLQAQGTTPGDGWSWGPLLDAPFLPRVIFGKVVLSPARWNVLHDEIRTLTSASVGNMFETVQAWRKERGLPRWVTLQDADNELPVDLDNILSIETFLHLIKGRANAVLLEMLPGPEELCAYGPEGRFVHELVIPFIRLQGTNQADHAAAAQTVRQDRGLLPQVGRSLAPGSEWLYVKLYTGVAVSDRLLTEVIRPFVGAWTQAGLIDRWFFIRYQDPHGHLRVRFHGQPEALLGVVLPALHRAIAPWLENGLVWRMQLDTYQREIERYGGPAGILLVEQVFHHDSETVLEILSEFSGEERAQARWRLALAGMDRFLTDLGMSLPEKASFAKAQRDAFAAEYRISGPVKGLLGDKFRVERSTLNPLFANTVDSPLSAGTAAFRRRSQRLQPVIGQIQSLADQGLFMVSMPELAGSLLHMHVNRLLRASQRTQESVLYEFLVRIYASLAARAVGQ